MALQPGTRVGPYEISAEIGAGGMGIVYRARDSRLGRDVAIKIAAERFTDRFEREARAVAALNHPNICTLHDVGPDYLVMELVEGETLADVLARRGAVPLDEALDIARQIAAALDAAHDKGVVHRDLKPGNIKIKADGTVKVLDFGLAKFGPDPSRSDSTHVPNITNSPTLGATAVGLIVGTAAYMAPEQARGKEVDKRADIWAFGVVLYEMVTGKQPFDGEDVSTILAAVIQSEPRWESVPASVQRLLKKCLEKDPKRRLRDIGDAFELIDATPRPQAAQPLSGRIGWMAAGIFALATALALWAPWRDAPTPLERPLVRMEVDLGTDVALVPLRAPTPSSVAIAPDGSRLVYVAASAGVPPRLMTRRLDELAPREIPGSEGAANPFFSPDGRWVGFLSSGKLNKIAIDGGAPVPLLESGVYAGATWSQADEILVGLGLDRGVLQVPTGGQMPTELVRLKPGDLFYATPQLLPGGKAVLMSVYGSPPSVDRATVDVVTLSDGTRKTIARGGASARYLSSGHVVYTNRSTMFAAVFDVDALEIRGVPVPVLNDIAFDPAAGFAQFDTSHDGTLVYRRSAAGVQAPASVQSTDAKGVARTLYGNPADHASAPRVSPDGKRLVMVLRDGASQDVWVYDTQRDVTTRLTFGEKTYVSPLWTRDGKYVVFGSVGEGILWAQSDGGGRPQLLVPTKSISFPTSFSPDGKRLAYHEISGVPQIWTVAIEQTDSLKASTPERFQTTPFAETLPRFSPDGRWLAYESDESGRSEVYVRAFGVPGTTQPIKRQISNGGGTAPQWSPTGRDILYRAGGQLMAVAYTASGDTFMSEKPRMWMPVTGPFFEVAPDGRVISLIQTGAPDRPRQEHTIVFVQNFFDELRRRVPAGQ